MIHKTKKDTQVNASLTVSVNDDLAAGQTSVAVRATDDETTRWVDVVDGVTGRGSRRCCCWSWSTVTSWLLVVVVVVGDVFNHERR